MRAVTIESFGATRDLVVRERDPLVAGPGEVVVDIRAAALNRRDVRVITGGWPGCETPLTPGSDGCGVVRSLGPGAGGVAVGDEVVILPSLGWGDDITRHGPEFRILGGPDDGTFAEQVRVPAQNVFPKPARLSVEQTAALPLAGLTVWRALFTRGRLRSGQTVLITGAGAGTSTFAVQLAHAAGARVLVTSSSADKLERARELGAEAGFDYRASGFEHEVVAYTGGGADLVIDSAGTWESSLACVRTGGTIVTMGFAGPPRTEIGIPDFYRKQVSLIGTMMGGPVEFRELLAAVDSQSWIPIVDSARPLDEAPAAFDRMLAGEQFGKLVLTA